MSHFGNHCYAALQLQAVCDKYTLDCSMFILNDVYYEAFPISVTTLKHLAKAKLKQAHFFIGDVDHEITSAALMRLYLAGEVESYILSEVVLPAIAGC